MKATKLASDFVFTFAIIFVVGMIVTFVYNLLVYRTSMIDGETSFRLALILGISLPFIQRLSSSKKK
jgi:hypothetical protein